MEKKKVGILGGTFNPIHFGHLILAENAYSQFGLDVVLIMPTENPHYKDISDLASKEHRNKMIRLAIDDNRHFKLSLFEQERGGLCGGNGDDNINADDGNDSGNLNRYRYTADTLRMLKENNEGCDYYLIIGGDSFINMGNWYRPDEIFKNAAAVFTAARNNANREMILQRVEEYKHKYGSEEVKVDILDIPHIGISSGIIRENIKKGKSIKYLVPKDIEKYIYNNKLYL